MNTDGGIRNMNRLFLVTFLFCSLVPIPGADPGRQQRRAIAPKPTSISLINLIATPERFDGKMVSVVGFLAVESEDARLYLSQEDYRRNIMGNGIFIEVNKEVDRDIEQKDLHYVGLVGVFKQKGLPLHFPGGAGDAGITDIRQCLALPELTDTRPRKLKETQPQNPQ
jgi:hypothetical protein